MRLHGLLVSVRSAVEAREALAGGAAVVDVKEPARGPLGAAAAEVVAEIAVAVGRAVPWTMACGELAQGIDPVRAHVGAVLAALPPGAPLPSAAKVGLAEMAGRPWQGWLQALGAALPEGCGQVAVAYADGRCVGAPPVEQVIEAAAAAGCRGLLVDTADKAGPGLLAAAPFEQIARWVAAARQRGLVVALAGRIGLTEVAAVAPLDPDVVALRSAVCSNGRLGTVDRVLVRRAAMAVGAAVRPAPAVAHG